MLLPSKWPWHCKWSILSPSRHFSCRPWGADGTIVFAAADTHRARERVQQSQVGDTGEGQIGRRLPDQSSGLWRVAAVGGEPEQLTTPDPEHGEVHHLWPEILPGGHAVLFTINTSSALGNVLSPTGAVGQRNVENMEIAVLDLETGQHQVIIRGGSNPRYSPTGHVVYGVESTLWVVRFDLDRLETLGDPVPVQEGVLTKGGGAASFSFSENGSLVYFPQRPMGAERTLVWVDRQGREESVGAPPRPYGWPRISPDGTRLVVGVADPANTDLWIYDLARVTSTRLTFDAAMDSDPLWTPDGERVVFRSGREGGGLFWLAADGTGPIERLTTGANLQRPYARSGDGQLLVYHEDPAPDLWVLSLEGDREPELLLQRSGAQRRPAVSPDGRWLAYMSNESGREEVYVQPFPGLDGKWLISANGGIAPVWGPDGRELFYRNGQAVLVTLRTGEPRGAL